MVDVRVKPLVWSTDELGRMRASTEVGVYLAESDGKYFEIVLDTWATLPGFSVSEWIGDGGQVAAEERAYKAAQADFERRIRSTLSDAVSEREAEPVDERSFIYDSEATPNMRTSPPTSELEALRKRVAELEGARDLAVQDLITIDGHDDKWAKLWRATDRAEAAEARVVELEKAVDGLLAPFEHDECRKDHHGYCQAHFLEEECCVATARRVREGGKVDG